MVEISWESFSAGRVVMLNQHEGRYICGYCKKETPLNDKDLIKYIEDGKRTEDFKCSCGHFSYASTIRFKATLNAKDWRFGHGTTKT